MKLNFYFYLLFLLTGTFAFGQPTNDECDNAIRLCPGTPVSASTTGATASAGDYGFCYTPENTVWFIFTTNSVGGAATISFSNLTFNTDPDYGQNLQAFFFSTGGDCGVTPFTPMSNCGDANTDFSISELIVLDPNTTYYVQVSGSSDGVSFPSECDFDISISGSAVETPDPTVTISADNTTICQGYDETITVTSTDCSEASYYEWVYNGVTIYEGSENEFSTAMLTESGTLELILTCNPNCPKSATSNVLNIEIIPVEANAGEDQFIQKGDQTVLNGSGIGVPTWTPGTTLTSTDVLTPVASPENSTTYYLTMENEGCFATDTVTVFVDEVIIIYSAFSPNNDGINDRWRIINSDQFPDMEVNIYDRSGQQVFSAINYTSEEQWWDGTFKGKPLPTSTYYYVIRLNDTNSTEYKGYVNIIR